MTAFARSAIFLFLALRAGDLVSIAAGMWFVPRYVSPEDIGAVLPVTSFATFIASSTAALAVLRFSIMTSLFPIFVPSKIRFLG